MAIEYDPHKKIETNLQRGEEHTINTNDTHRVIVPMHAPFYYSSLVVKQNGKMLTEQVDYYVTHRYEKGTHRTAMLSAGSIWIINDDLGGNIQIDYHPLGINEATRAQVTKERTDNADVYPSDCRWEDVVGDLYFPPVDIIFDREDWHGEKELIDAFDALGVEIQTGGWKTPAVHSSDGNVNFLLPDGLSPVDFSHYVVKKVINVGKGDAVFRVRADNAFKLYHNGELVMSGENWESYTEGTVKLVGNDTIAIYTTNGTGPTFVGFSIQGTDSTVYSDTTWLCRNLQAGENHESSVGIGFANNDVIKKLNLWFTSLHTMWRDSKAHEHVIDTNNPHNETYSWIGALERNGISRDATRIFNRLLPDLTAHINAQCMNDTDLLAKIRRTGQTLSGEMVMANGLAYITSHVSTNRQPDQHYDYTRELGALQSYLFTANGIVNNSTTKGLTIGSTENRPVTLVSGNERLTLYPDERGLQWNGKKVLTAGTIGPLVPRPDGVSSNINVVNSSTVTIEKLNGDTLRIEWVVPEDTQGVCTLRPVSNEYGNSSEKGATPSLVARTKQLLDGKLESGVARINGFPLTESVFLGPADWGLGNIKNISDANLPISEAQLAKIDTYSVKNHTHDLADFNILHATTERKGVFRLMPPTENSIEGLNAKYVKEMFAKIKELDKEADSLMSSGTIKITRYGTSGDAIINVGNFSGFVLNITAEMFFYHNSAVVAKPTTINLKSLFPNINQPAGEDDVEKKLYVYVDLLAGEGKYSVYDFKKTETEAFTLVGELIVGESGILECTFRNATRLGQYGEFVEHVEATTNIHGYATSKDELELDKVANLPPSYSFTKPTFLQVFETFRRFSHGAAGTSEGHHTPNGDVQPANPHELNSWIYNGATDSVIQPVNCGSFVGFASPTKHDKYVFDTVLSSNAADNDGIGVLLGFYVDETGQEKTLSFICAPNGLGFGAGVSGTFALGFKKLDHNLFFKTKKNVPLNGQENWNISGSRRVKVTRHEDDISLELYVANSESVVEERLELNLQTGAWRSVIIGGATTSGVFAGDIISRLNGFRGAQPFGYVSNSQPNSTYRNIRRPDQDAENYYATMPSLMESVGLSRIRTYSGTSSSLSGKTHDELYALIPPPKIKDWNGKERTIAKENVKYYISGTRWVMVCHLDGRI